MRHNKEAVIIDFYVPKLSLGSHTVHGLSFCLRTPLVIPYTLWVFYIHCSTDTKGSINTLR